MSHITIPPYPKVSKLLIAFALIAVGTAHAEEGPFVSLTLEQAFKDAKEQNKIVFVDFYTTWCPPCKMLDQTTFKDKKVIAWLNEKSIPIKIDAEKHWLISNRYKIEFYPTLLFLKPDGSEMDRITGFVKAKDFLAEAKAILAGKNALTRAKEKLEAAGQNNPMARMDYAQVLARAGKHEKALEEFLWCYDHGLEHGPAFYGVRISFLLSDIARLGEKYPPALAALRHRRDQVLEKILADQAEMIQVLEFQSLNDNLGVPEETLALYDQLRSKKPDMKVIPILREQVSDQLREHRRYAELYETMDISAEVDNVFELHKPNWFSKLLMLKYSKEQREQLDEANHEVLVRNVAEYYEILVGVGKLDEADKVAKRLLKYDDSARTYNNLAWAGHLTGKPTEANLEQARKAYELTEGQNAAMVDTLAQILDAREQRQEAHAILRKAIQEIDNPYHREKLQECLAKLGGVSFAERCWTRYQQAWQGFTQSGTDALLALAPILALVLILAVGIHRARLRSRNRAAAAEAE